MGKYENGASSRRNTAWQLVGYPESLELFWKDLLDRDSNDWYISPLHDKDIFEKDESHKGPDGVIVEHKAGEKKKAHYHVLVKFDSLKSWEQVKEWAEKLGFATIQSVMSWSGALRYLCHLDGGKGKATYNVKDVECLNDDYLTAINKASDKEVITKDIITFIKSENIGEFSALISKALEVGSDWLSEIRHYAYFYKSLCQSVQFRSRGASVDKIARAVALGCAVERLGNQDVSVRDEYDSLPF